MQPLNTHLVHELAEQHADEVRRAVRQSSRRGPTHPRRTRSRLRYRTGWLLVDLGLRMTSSAGASTS
jgi:hypothetical protein